MPDITPDSPLAALWPDGEGGLSGAHARGRLAAAGITTVAALTASTAAGLARIDGMGRGRITETRRALAASGLALAGERAPSARAAQQAREQGAVLRTRHARRRHEEPPPATPEDFAALVKDLRGELAASDREQRARFFAYPRRETPASFTGRPWVWATTGPAGAAAVTGYAPSTIRRRVAESARAWAAGTQTGRTMPPPRGGRWAIGDLALWTATRNEGQAATVKLTDEDAAQILAELASVETRTPGGRRPMGTMRDLAERHGVHKQLINKLSYGEVPATGREGPDVPRERRRAALIPVVRALYGREGRITAAMVAAETGTTDSHTAWKLIREAGLLAEARRAEDEDAAAFCAQVIARQRKYVTAREMQAAAAGAGLRLTRAQVTRVLPGVRAAEMRRRTVPVGTGRARGESLRADGLLYASEVAQDYGVSAAALTAARKRGEVTPARREGTRTLYDPARLRPRRDRRRTPVDRDHPMARPDEEDQ